MLLELEEVNAFVVSLDAQRTWFRYHQLLCSLRATLAPRVDHRIWVLSAHLLEQHRPGVTHDLYQIRIKGRLGVTALSAFPSMAGEGWRNRAHRLLGGQLRAVRVLAEIEALGLELLELRQIPTGPKSP